MARVLLTQVFPWLWPIREKQKKFCFYTKLKLDQNQYATIQKDEQLTFLAYQVSSDLINYESGYDITYQHNKVENLKLATKTIDGLIISPLQAFSFWHRVKQHSKYGEFKEGLNVIRGQMQTVKGGGLCQLSNMLYELFLHSECSILERRGHDSISIPIIDHNQVLGIDTTVNEGWLDFKVKNNSNVTYQIKTAFDQDKIILSLYCDVKPYYTYQLYNQVCEYQIKDNEYYLHTTLNCKKFKDGIVIFDQELLDEYKRIGYDYHLIPQERVLNYE